MNEMGSWNEAVDHCKVILGKFRPKHGRIRVFCGFEVEPALWSDCSHTESPEEALEMAKREDDDELRVRRGSIR